MCRFLLPACLLVLLSVVTVSGQDFRAEKTDKGPPVDELTPEIGKMLSPQGVKVIRGTSRSICEIWLCKQVEVDSFDTESDVLYPFKPGQLIGVMRFPRNGGDFREQEIARGVYTIRYSHQPIDGAHEGTSPTRDFALLLLAEDDRSTKLLDYDSLTGASADAAASNHPALLSLQAAADGKAPPLMRHDERRDYWITRLACSVKAGDKTKDLLIDMVIIGHADE